MEVKRSLEIESTWNERRSDLREIVPSHSLAPETVGGSQPATANPRKACGDANTLLGTATIGGAEVHSHGGDELLGKHRSPTTEMLARRDETGKIPVPVGDTDQGAAVPSPDPGTAGLMPTRSGDGSRKRLGYDGPENSRSEPLDDGEWDIQFGDFVPEGLELGGGGGPWYVQRYGADHSTYSKKNTSAEMGLKILAQVSSKALPLAPDPVQQVREVLSGLGDPPRLKRSEPAKAAGKGNPKGKPRGGGDGKPGKGKGKGKGVAPPPSPASNPGGKPESVAAAAAAAPPQIDRPSHPVRASQTPSVASAASSTGGRCRGTRASKKSNAVNGALIDALQQAAGERDAKREMSREEREHKPSPEESKESAVERLHKENLVVADATYVAEMQRIPKRARNRPFGASPIPDGYAPNGIGPSSHTGYLPGGLPGGQIFVRFRQLSNADQDTIRSVYEHRMPTSSSFVKEVLMCSAVCGASVSIFGFSELLYGRFGSVAAKARFRGGTLFLAAVRDCTDWAARQGYFGTQARILCSAAHLVKPLRHAGEWVADNKGGCFFAALGLIILHHWLKREDISPQALVRITYNPGSPEMLADDLRPQNHRTSRLDADGWHTPVAREFSLWNNDIPESFPVSRLVGSDVGFVGWWRELLSVLGLARSPAVGGRLRDLDTSTTLSAMVFQHMSVSGDNDTAIRNHFASLFYTTNVNLDPFTSVQKDTREYLLAVTSNLNGIGQYVRYHQGFATVFPPTQPTPA